MEVRRIHACKNDCILYHGDAFNLREYPVCKFPRFKVPNGEAADDTDESSKKKRKKKPGRKDISVKVCWYLLIIPRLKRLYSNQIRKN
jgi:hypothetical protein